MNSRPRTFTALFVALFLPMPARAEAKTPAVAVAAKTPIAQTVQQLHRAPPAFPQDVKARGDRLWNAASPAVKAWANQQVTPLLRGQGDSEAAARAAAHTRWPNLRPAATYDALAFIAIYRAAKTSQDAIKNDLDSMSELGETLSLRLQMAMDRLSKMMEALSNLLKKISDTADGIVSNLK